MAFVNAIAERSILLFGGLLFLAQIACYSAGQWYGRRKRGRGAPQPESVGVVVGAMLGLLAFVLALTLSFASARFSERQAGSLAEANAIGVAWLRATAIGGSQGEAIADLLEQYALVRMDFVRAEVDENAINLLNQRTRSLQSEIWSHLTAIVREKPDDISGALMEALNETFNASAAERFAFDLRLPPQTFWLLMGITLLSMASLGYQFGLRDTPVRAMVGLLTLMWTLVIINILDLASARLGPLRADVAPYEWTLERLNSGAQSP